MSRCYDLKQESPPAGNSKRRTARAITSPSTTCPGDGGYPPILSWDLTWDLTWMGYPLEGTWDQWKYYRMEMEDPPPQRTWGQWLYVLWDKGRVPPFPPPPSVVDKVKTLPSVISRMRAAICTLRRAPPVNGASSGSRILQMPRWRT